MRNLHPICIAILFFSVSPIGAEDLQVTAEQGAVARWTGAEAESCGMDGAMWPSIEGACYYPIDLQRSPGRVEIARWQPEKSIETAWLDIKDKKYELQEIEIDEKFVHLSEENLARHREEQAKIQPILAMRDGDPRFTLPLGDPVKPPVPEARDFGARREYNGEPRSPHSGSDFSVVLGHSVQAVADGEVVLTGDHFFAGKSVYVYHGDGLVSAYFHLSEIGVEDGEEVSAGDSLGKSGETGRTTGPHLHLGISWREAWIHPVDLLSSPDKLPTVGAETKEDGQPEEESGEES